jgi:hypothetical protein
MDRILLMQERILVAAETCLLAVAYQWTTFVVKLCWLSAVMPQYDSSTVLVHYHKK